MTGEKKTTGPSYHAFADDARHRALTAMAAAQHVAAESATHGALTALLSASATTEPRDWQLAAARWADIVVAAVNVAEAAKLARDACVRAEQACLDRWRQESQADQRRLRKEMMR